MRAAVLLLVAALATPPSGGALAATTPSAANPVFQRIVAGLTGPLPPSPESRSAWMSEALPPAQADEIHWTILGPTSITLSWRGPSDLVRYGVNSAYGRVARGKVPTPYPVSSPGPFWEARITGLHPNTVYHYAIDGGPDHVFRTPPPPGLSDFVVGAEGDIGDAQYYSRVAPIQSQVAAMSPRFGLLVGDLTYGNDHGQAAVDRHFNDMMVWSQDAAYMPTWGNHEWEGDSLSNYKGRFDLPNPRRSPGAPDTTGDDWYWFDYGNVRFIVYPEPYAGAWADWNTRARAVMDSAEADPAIRYIVTAGHRPAFSTGHHSGSTTLKNYLNALGASHPKYVLNVNGHSHNYERSHPQNGVIHITAGGGGATLEADPVGGCLWKGGCPPPAWSAYRAMRHGPVRLEFTGSGIIGQMICGPAGDARNPNDVICTLGEVIDQFVIGAPDRAPVIGMPAVVTVARGSRVEVAVTAADPDGAPIASLTADLSELPAGHNAAFVTPGPAAGTFSWNTTLADGHRTYFVTLRAANAQTAAATLAIRVTGPDAAPIVTAPSALTAYEGQPIFLGITAADPDGDDLETLTANLAGLPAGHGATFIINHPRTSGTLIWTPSFDAGGQSFPVTFTSANALSGSKTTTINVVHVDRIPAVTGPLNAVAGPGVPFVLTVSAGDPDGDPLTSLVADLSKLSPGHGATFTAGSGWTSGTLRWTPAAGLADSVFPVRFTAANALTGYVVTNIRVTRANRSPVAELEILPAGGVEPQIVTADAGVSSDPDGNPLTYVFDFGDGAQVGPQSGASATHAYAAGVWIARVTVSDGLLASESPPIMVSVAQNLVTHPSFENGSTGWKAYSGSTLATVPGGQHGDSALRVTGPATTATFGLNDSPNWVLSTNGAGTRYRYAGWVRTASAASSVRLRVREYSGSVQVGANTSSPSLSPTGAWQRLEADHVAAAGGNTLDFQVIDTPSAPSEAFDVDNLSVRIVSTPGPAGVDPNWTGRAFSLDLSPNPVRSNGRVLFSTTRTGPLSLALYDVQGRLVRRLIDRTDYPAGEHQVALDGGRGPGERIAAGVYYCRLAAAEGTRIRRIAIVP